MLAHVPMELSSDEGKLWGRYDDNCEKCFLQDIIAHFNDDGEAVYHFQDPISSHIYFDMYTKCDDCLLAHLYGEDEIFKPPSLTSILSPLQRRNNS